MTIDEILATLGNEGVEVTRSGAGLKVRATKGPLTENQRKLITENKTALLARFGAQVAPTVSPPQEDLDNSDAVYKEYAYPNGDVLRLTKAEFRNVVDVFKMLMEQETKLILQGKRLKRL